MFLKCMAHIMIGLMAGCSTQSGRGPQEAVTPLMATWLSEYPGISRAGLEPLPSKSLEQWVSDGAQIDQVEPMLWSLCQRGDPNTQEVEAALVFLQAHAKAPHTKPLIRLMTVGQNETRQLASALAGRLHDDACLSTLYYIASSPATSDSIITQRTACLAMTQLNRWDLWMTLDDAGNIVGCAVVEDGKHKVRELLVDIASNKSFDASIQDAARTAVERLDTIPVGG